MDFALVLDIVIVVLLVPTIIYAVMLDRQLKVLRKSRQELVRLIEAFNEATHRAETGLPKLRQLAKDAGGGLQEQVEKAQSIRDDLAYMNERAQTLVGAMEKTIRNPRETKAERAPIAPSPTAASPTKAEPKLKRSGVSERNDVRDMPSAATQAPAKSMEGRAKTMLGAMALGQTHASEDAFGEGRSESEKELLKAMQSMK